MSRQAKLVDHIAIQANDKMSKNLAAIFRSHWELLQSVFDRSQIIMNITEIRAPIRGTGGLEAFK